MNRKQRCEYLKEKGYTYNSETGEVFGVRGNVLKRKDDQGYLVLAIYTNKKNYNLYQHHYAWYMTYGNVDFEMLDHKNQITNDNRISNLRIITNQENLFNTNAKGYCWDRINQKWMSRIKISGKQIYLGRYNTEEDARQSYLIAKEKYHIIN
tara:strand:- start:86 stop:541 length:456 start_codon:yes stop_codon:yes gene_type:complete